MLAGFSNYVFVIEYCLEGLAHNRPGRAMSNQVYDWSQSDEWNLEHLLEDVTTPTGRLITFGDIQRELGDEAYQVIVTVFEQAQGFNAGLKPAYLAMSVSGMTLDDPRRLVMIDQLSAAGYGADGSQPWPTQWVTQIKAMAVTVRPRWQIVGLSQEPTLASIAAARVRHEATLALNDVKQRSNLAVSEASSVYDLDGTAAEISAAAQTAWAGGG